MLNSQQDFRRATALRHRMQLVNFTNAELVSQLKRVQRSLASFKSGRELYMKELTIYALHLELRARGVGKHGDTLRSERKT